MEMKFSVLPSYRQVRRITFDTSVTYGLHERQRKTIAIEGRPAVRNLRVESPKHATVVVRRPDGVAIGRETPLLFDVTARIDLLDARGQFL